MRYIFHLSIPVHALEAARDFYVQVLGARVGRQQSDWLDVLLWGHQITLQLRPDEVPTPEEQGKRHFGVVLPWDAWQALADRLRDAGVTFLRDPQVSKVGTPAEQAKLYLRDPSHNVVEIKAYRQVAAVLHLGDEGYETGSDPVTER